MKANHPIVAAWPRSLLIFSLLFPASPGTAGTVAYWRFEEGPPDTQVLHWSGMDGVWSPDVPDSSGNGNALSVWTGNTWAGFAYRYDVANESILASGEPNDYSVQNTGGYPAMWNNTLQTWTPASFTIEASFKPESGGWRTVVGRDSRGATSFDPKLAALYLQITPQDAVAFKFTDVSGYWYDVTSAPGLVTAFPSGNPAAGQWYSLAGVSDGQILSLYLSSNSGSIYRLVAQTNLAAGGSPNTALTPGLGSGGDWTAGDFSVGRGMYDGAHADRAYGFIDEVRLSDTALDPGQFLFADPAKVYITQNPTPPSQVVTAGDPAGLQARGGAGYAGAGWATHWRHEGTNVGSGVWNLNIPATKLSDSGVYDVVVFNTYSSLTSTPAVITVVPPQAPVLSSPAWLPGGSFQLGVTGTPGKPYVLQARTNLAGGTWLPLCTNTSPFSFADSNAAACPARYYRAVWNP